MANQNVTQLPQQSGTANTSSVFYAVTGGTTDTGLPLSVLFNSPTFTGSPTVPNYAPLAGATFTGEVKARYASAQISVDDPASNSFCAFYWKGNAVQNWAMMFDTTTPALKLMRYNGSGSFQDTPWQCNWTTGLLTQLNTTFTGTTTINGTLTGTGLSTYLASPPAIGGTTAAAGSFTTLSASGNDALMYQNTSAQSIPNNTATTVTTWTKVADRVNANFNASTGTFTAPATGFYQISAAIGFGTAAGVVSAIYTVTIVANAVTVASGRKDQETTSSTAVQVQANAIVQLTAGQTVVVQATQNTGVARTLSASGTLTYLSINRIA